MIGWICTVCGQTTQNAKGSMKHPICASCYENPKRKQEWLEQLRYYHPDLYNVFKK